MGRNRVITEDQILDAAEQAVVKQGAGQLTIEAVAAEAGISKASVLYVYKTKKALIEAVVDRRVSADIAINEAAIRSVKDGKDAVIQGRILASSELMTDEMRSVALNLCASVANEPQLRQKGKDYIKSTVERIKRTCDHPQGAMLAFLALEGVRLLELVDWHAWTGSERKRLVADIQSLTQLDMDREGPKVKSIPRHLPKHTARHSKSAHRLRSKASPRTSQ